MLKNINELDGKLLLTRDAAKMLDVGDRRVQGLHAEGLLPATITPGGVRVYLRADVEKLAAARKKKKQTQKV